MIQAYRVTVTDDALDSPFIADTMASSADAAGKRVRMAMVQTYRHVEFLYSATDVVPITDDEYNA